MFERNPRTGELFAIATDFGNLQPKPVQKTYNQTVVATEIYAHGVSKSVEIG